MTTPKVFDYTSQDFADIVASIKTYLKNQDRFKDYDFDGASLAILIDTLAYITSQTNFTASMVAAESFLDSATRRDSLISRAKHIGYTPRTARSARVLADITIDSSDGGLSNNTNPPFISFGSELKYRITDDNNAYLFQPIGTYTATKISENTYLAKDVEMVEGEFITQTFIVNSDVEQKFILNNNRIDETTIQVKVLDEKRSGNEITYFKYRNFTTLNRESDVYFLQEFRDDTLEIYFGDGNIGRRPNAGSIVTISYVVSSGTQVNGLQNPKIATLISGYSTLTTTFTQQSSGATEKESDASVRKNAPIAFQAQSRGVTARDIETLVETNFENVEFISAWGGEENDPPFFGKVFVSVKPKDRTFLTLQEKDQIISEILEPRSVLGIEHEIVDPDFLFLEVESLPRFKSTETSKTIGEINQIVTKRILEFATVELNGFGDDFRYSRLLQYIDSSDASLISNITNVRLKKKIFPPFFTTTRIEARFNNAISRGDAANKISAVTSSQFVWKGGLSFFSDDGKGNLCICRLANTEKVVVEPSIGTVDYDTGIVIVPRIQIQNIPDEQDFIDITATLVDRDVEARRQQIIVLQPDDIKVNSIQDTNYTRGN